MAYDAGDAPQVKAKKTKQQLIQEREEAELKAVLDTYEGRAVMWKLMSLCGIYSSSFTGDERTYFNEGKREIGLNLIAMIEDVQPHVMAVIRDEAVKRTENG